MTPPKTNYESVGSWTTLAQEINFLDQIVEETALTEHLAGYSVENRPIRYFMIGQGAENTILLSSMVHGIEKASREGLLIALRDICYSTDPDVLTYLQTHRMVWLPNSNPDGTLTTRENALGIDPNRDRFKLLQPETLAVVTVINETSPQLVIDCHEYYTTGEDWWGFQSHLPGAYPAVRSLEEEIFQHGLTLMGAHGYSAKQYPLEIVPRACTTGYTTSRHAVSLTSETNGLHGEVATRVAVHVLFLDFIIGWHKENSGRCALARQQSMEWAVTSTGYDELMIREQYIHNHPSERVRLAGYQLQEPLPQRLIDMHGIVVDEDGFVSMNQEARLVIPQILDPAAMDRQVEAVRVLRTSPGPVPPGEPLPRRKLLGYRVHEGGRTRDVIAMKAKINGRLRDIIMPKSPATEPPSMEINPPGIQAASAISITDSGSVMYSKTPDDPKIPASTIKVLTLYAARKWVTDEMLSDTCTLINADVVGGTGAGLKSGDIISWRDLFYAMMLPSANEAANCIARNVGQMILDSAGESGDPLAQFLIYMRHVVDTDFPHWGDYIIASASGLEGESRLTARQLAELLLRLDDISISIAGTYQRVLTISGASARAIPVAHSVSPDGAVKFPEMVAAKTGTLWGEYSLANLVMLWESPQGRQAIVILGVWPAGQRLSDARTVMDYIKQLPA